MTQTRIINLAMAIVLLVIAIIMGFTYASLGKETAQNTAKIFDHEEKISSIREDWQAENDQIKNEIKDLEQRLEEKIEEKSKEKTENIVREVTILKTDYNQYKELLGRLKKMVSWED